LPPPTQPPVEISPESEFKRGLSLLDATMLVVGSMIGSGIFIVSADIARQMNSPGGLLFVWVASGLITVFGALSYGELAAAMPRAGGQYVFLREGLGHLPGFLYGWTLFMVIQTGTIAAVAVAFAKFLAVFFPAVSSTLFASFGKVPMPGGEIELGLSWQRVVAIAIIALLTAVNMRGLREAKWIQNTFTFAKTGALLGLIVLAFAIGRNAGAISSNFSFMWADTVTGPRTTSFLGVELVLPAVLLAFGGAMVGSLFSSDAWNNVTFAAAEVKNPQRNLPLALALGTGLVTGLYLLANVAYLMVLRLSAIQNAPRTASAPWRCARCWATPGCTSWPPPS
jgi:APA family basic amino acid/polyamine antiporter